MEFTKGHSHSDTNLKKYSADCVRFSGDTAQSTEDKKAIICQTFDETVENYQKHCVSTPNNLCPIEKAVDLLEDKGVGELDLSAVDKEETIIEEPKSLSSQSQQEHVKVFRKKYYGRSNSETHLGVGTCQYALTDVENSNHRSEEAEGVQSLLRESSFRQKLNAEKKLIRDMVRHQSGRASIHKDKNFPCAPRLEKGTPNACTHESFFSVNQRSVSDIVEHEETGDDTAVDEKTASAKALLKNNSKDYRQRARAFTMPGRLDGDRYPPCYWLTCTYKMISTEDCLNAVIRQTGTLPNIQGKLCAKIYIEQENKVHQIKLAESQLDNSFRSHEIVFHKQTGTCGKVLVFRLYDQRGLFSKTSVGDWRIPLDDCSEKVKIVCRKFCSGKLNY